jgi:hypothetical protein
MRFSFTEATVTTPWGDTYVDIPVSVADMQMTYHLDGEAHVVQLIAGWAHGQRGYGMQDTEEREWGVKRSRGCGCG